MQMTDSTDSTLRSKQMDPPSSIPVEAALMCTAMAVATAVIPTGRGSAENFNEAMILGFAGFMLFLISKVSLISKGCIATWGPSPMSRTFKIAYVVGYLLMAVSAAGMALVHV